MERKFRFSLVSKLSFLVASLITVMVGLSVYSMVGHRSMMSSMAVNEQLTDQVHTLSEHWQALQLEYSTLKAASRRVIADRSDISQLQGPAQALEQQFTDFEQMLMTGWEVADEAWRHGLNGEFSLTAYLGQLAQQVAQLRESFSRQQLEWADYSIIGTRMYERRAADIQQEISAGVALLHQQFPLALNYRSGLLLQAQSGLMSAGLIALIGMVMIAIVITSVVLLNIRRRVDTMLHATERLASGDLSAELSADSRQAPAAASDELDLVLLAQQETRLELRQIVQQVEQVAQHLSEASEAMQDDTRQRMYDVEELSERLSELTMAMSQIGTASGQVTQSAIQSLSQVEQAMVAVTGGEHTVKTTVSQIESLSAETGHSVEAIRSVEQQSDEISKILLVIQNIAEQTNLLALNAAIEAARAGEHGRGFAVVADEVRSLARLTQESAGEIEQMLSALCEGASAAVESIQASYKNSLLCATDAASAGDALTDITGAVEGIRDLATQTSAAAEEQGGIITSLDSNMQQMAGTARSHREQSLTMQKRAEELRALSRKLQSDLDFFKV